MVGLLIVVLTSVILDRGLASQWSAQYSGYRSNKEKEDEVWTQWYNTDNPSKNGGDDETLETIKKRGYEVCPGYSIMSAQCRKVGSLEYFSESTREEIADLDNLATPCTKAGLHCINRDQDTGKCHDFEIRFRCKSGVVTDEAVYTWVAVLAVVFLVIPIAWVIVINMKRRYCPSAEDRSRSQRSANESGTSVSTLTDPSLAEPPPSYDELFGGGSPISSTVFGFGSTSALLENEVQGTTTNLSSNALRQSSSENTSPTVSGGIPSPTTTANQQRTTYIPGMHLPVFSFMRQLSGGLVTPPPTYDDAIVKLGVQPMKKDSS